MNVIPFPRPCRIETSGWGGNAICIAIVNGVALVETSDGRVSRYDLLDHVYSITFLDR